MIAALPLVSSALSTVLGSNSLVGAPQTPKVSGNGDTFSSILSTFTKDAVDKMKTSESTSIAGLQGNATTQSVVESVMQAQEALQTALAVRDKTVAAFQDVTRMAI